jgi:hypothetical protein
MNRFLSSFSVLHCRDWFVVRVLGLLLALALPAMALDQVTVTASVPTAYELNLQPGQYDFHRIGTTDNLTVNYTITGLVDTAVNYTPLPNVDYALPSGTVVNGAGTGLTGSVTFTYGVQDVYVTLTPIENNTITGKQVVVASITPNAAYIVGVSPSAQITIAEADLTAITEVPLPVAYKDLNLTGYINDPLVQRRAATRLLFEPETNSVIDRTVTFILNPVLGPVAGQPVAGTNYYVQWKIGGTNIINSTSQLTGTIGQGMGFYINNPNAYNVGDTNLIVSSGTGPLSIGDMISFPPDIVKYKITGTVPANIVGVNSSGAGNIIISPPLQIALTNGNTINAPSGVGYIINQPAAYQIGRTTNLIVGPVTDPAVDGIYAGDVIRFQNPGGGFLQGYYVVTTGFETTGSTGDGTGHINIEPFVNVGGTGGLEAPVSNLATIVTVFGADDNGNQVDGSPGGSFTVTNGRTQGIIIGHHSSHIELAFNPHEDGTPTASEIFDVAAVNNADFSLLNPTVGQITIADDNSIANIALGQNASKPNNAGSFVVTFTKAFPRDVTVPYQLLASSTAVPNVDYVPLSGSIVLPQGQTSITIPVAPLTGGPANPNGVTVSVALLSTLDYLLSGSGSSQTNPSATVNIADSQGSVGIASTAMATSTITGGAVTGLNLLVASAGYLTAPTVTFSGGGGSGAAATAIISGGSVTGFTITNGGANYTSAPTVIISSPPAAYKSPTTPGTATFTITIDHVPTTAVKVNYSIGGTAHSGVDFVALSGSVIIPAGQTSANVVLTPIETQVFLGTATVTLTIQAGQGYDIVSNTNIDQPTSSASVTLLDDVPVVTIGRGPVDAALPSTHGSFIISYAPNPGGPLNRSVSIPYTLGGTAALSRYASTGATGGGAGIITIPANQSSTIIDITPIEDQLFHPEQTITATLTGGGTGAAYALSQPTTATINIFADAPTLIVNAGNNATEPNTPGSFVISYPGTALTFPINVSYAITGSATAGFTYTALTGSVTIPAGSNLVTVPVQPLEDHTVDPFLTVTLGLVASPSYGIGNPSSASILINNADVGVSSVTADPNTPNGTYGPGQQLTIDVNFNGAVQVSATTATATATITSGAITGLTITNGGGGYTAAPPVTLLGGGGVGATATATITGGVVTGLTITNAGSGYTSAPTVYIPSPVQLVLNTGTVNTVVGYSSGSGSNVLSFVYTVKPGDANTLLDYATTGALSGPIYVLNSPVTAILNLPSPGSSGSAGDPGSLSANASLNIQGGPAYTGVVSIAANAPKTATKDSVSPTICDFVVTLNRTTSLPGPITVNYTVSSIPNIYGNMAVANVDYEGLSGSVTVPSGQSTALIPIIPIDSQIPVGTVNLTITLQPGQGYSVAASPNNVDSIGIIDDTPPPSTSTGSALDTVYVMATTSTAYENGLVPGVFTFYRTGSIGTLTVNFVTSGIANVDGYMPQSGVDYQPLPQSVTFQAGETSEVVNLIPIDNGVIKGRGQVSARIFYSPTSYIIGANPAAVITIAEKELTAHMTVPSPLAYKANLAGTSLDPNAARRGIQRVQFSPINAPITRTVIMNVAGTGTVGTNYNLQYKVGGTNGGIPTGTAGQGLGYVIDQPNAYPASTVALPQTVINLANANAGVGTAAPQITRGDHIRFGTDTTDVYVALNTVLGQGALTIQGTGAIPGLVAPVLNGATVSVTNSTDTAPDGFAGGFTVSQPFAYLTGNTTGLIVDSGLGGLYAGDVIQFDSPGTTTNELTGFYVITAGFETHPGTIDIRPFPGTIGTNSGLSGNIVTQSVIQTVFDLSVANQQTAGILMGPESSHIDFLVNPIEDHAPTGALTVLLTMLGDPDYTLQDPTVGTVTIADDNVTANISLLQNASKPLNSGFFQVTFSQAFTHSVVVPYQVLSTSTAVAQDPTQPANPAADYTLLSGTVTMPAGQTSITIPVNPVPPTLSTPAHPNGVTVQVALLNSLDYLLAGSGSSQTNPSATVNISDAIGQVGVTASTTPAYKSQSAPGTATFTISITRTQGASQALSVNYMLSGSATLGTDYQTTPVSQPGVQNSVTIPAGQNSISITVTPLETQVAVGTTTVSLSILAGQGYVIDPLNATASISILDDVPVISITPGPDAALPSTHGSFTVSYVGTPPGTPLTRSVTIPYTLGGTAASSRYTVNGVPGSITIPANALQTVIDVTPIDDRLYHPTETITATLSPNASYVLSPSSTATINLIDNAPVVSIGAYATVVPIGSNTAPATGASVFGFSIPTTDSLSWFQVGDNVVVQNLQSPSDAALNQPYIIRAINATSTPPTLTLDRGLDAGTTIYNQTQFHDIGLNPSEAVSPGFMRVSYPGVPLGTALPYPVTVSYTVGGTATPGAAAGLGIAYQQLSTSVVIPANSLSAEIPITAWDDMTVDPGLTVSATLNPSTSYSIEYNTDTVTIQDNDAAITDVRSTKPAGIYTVTSIIPIQITFIKPVNVTGTPTLLLATGTTQETAVFVPPVSPDGKTLTFDYQVQAGDASASLEYVSTTSLSGNITSQATGTQVLEALPPPGMQHSLSYNSPGIVIDGSSAGDKPVAGSQGNLTNSSNSGCGLGSGIGALLMISAGLLLRRRR